MDKLDSTSRCDGCGAQAYVSILLDSGTVLLFCGSHWDRNKHILQDAGEVDDSALMKMRHDIQNPEPVDA